MQNPSATRSPTRSSFASATGGFVTTAVRTTAPAKVSRGQGTTTRR